MSDATLCGKIVTTAGGNRKPCKLLPNHEGKCNTAPRKEYAAVSLTDLGSFKVVVNPNERKALAPKNAPGVKKQERTPVMLQFDKQCQELYDAWVKAGKPEEFSDSPIGKIHVTEDKVESVRFLIGKSVQFIGKGLQYGDSGVKDTQGRTVISWRVIDKRKYNRK